MIYYIARLGTGDIYVLAMQARWTVGRGVWGSAPRCGYPVAPLRCLDTLRHSDRGTNYRRTELV